MFSDSQPEQSILASSHVYNGAGIKLNTGSKSSSDSDSLFPNVAAIVPAPKTFLSSSIWAHTEQAVNYTRHSDWQHHHKRRGVGTSYTWFWVSWFSWPLFCWVLLLRMAATCMRDNSSFVVSTIGYSAHSKVCHTRSTVLLSKRYWCKYRSWNALRTVLVNSVFKRASYVTGLGLKVCSTVPLRLIANKLKIPLSRQP